MLGGVAFIFLTNVFAVYAPSLIGEGVNALKDMDAAVLEPLREGATETDVFSESMSMDYPTFFALDSICPSP